MKGLTGNFSIKKCQKNTKTNMQKEIEEKIASPGMQC